MGYRGKVEAQNAARDLRAVGATLAEIAAELGVSKSSVSVWVREVPHERGQRTTSARGPRGPHPLHLAKLAEIDECDRLGRGRIGELSDEAFLVAGVALYAGEGAKTGNEVKFANTDASMIAFFCSWLRRFFEVDEQRLRARVYLHEGLDLDAAEEFWAGVTRIPRAQFRAPYRAAADPTIRHAKHVHGCAYVRYSCARTLRELLGLSKALLSSDAIPG